MFHHLTTCKVKLGNLQIVNLSEHEENTCEMEFAIVPSSNNQENETNQLTDESERLIADEVFSEEPENVPLDLYLEQLRLKIKKLRKSVSDVLEEYGMTLNRRREEILKEDLEVKEKNKNKIAEVIRHRLLTAYDQCKDYRHQYEKFINGSWKTLKRKLDLSDPIMLMLPDSFSLIENYYPVFEERLATINTLMTVDYDSLCQENNDCYDVVMAECNNVDYIFYDLLSLLLRD